MGPRRPLARSYWGRSRPAGSWNDEAKFQRAVEGTCGAREIGQHLA
ncbi:hypothetical protein ACE14D_10425 [Streptomyces sp. Act-28]